MSLYTYIHRSGCVRAIFIVACIKFAVDSGTNGLQHFFVASSACGHLQIEIGTQVRVVKIQVVKFWVTQPFCFFNIKKDLITFDCIALQIGSNIFFCIFYLWSFRDKMQRQKYVEDFGILILSRLDRRNSGENLVQIFICLIFIYFLKIF